MNVLNRSGAFIFGLVFIVATYIFNNNFAQDFWEYKSGNNNLWFFTWALLFGSELVYYWKKNDWYLYKFYPIDFFDRNFLVILIYLNLAVFFSDIFLHPVSIIIFVIILILNELRMRKVYKKRAIRDNDMKEILGHQGYDGEKIVLKKTSKNFFFRTWFFYLAMIPFLIFDIRETSEIMFRILFRTPIILLVLYEEYNRRKIYKEIKEIMGENAIVTDR